MKTRKYIYGFVISLFMGIAACSEGVENMPRPMNVPEGFHAVSVPFHLPTGKPMYSEEGGSRGTSTDGTWAVNDELLMQLTATNTSESYTLYLKLKCTATNTSETWEVVTGESYVEYNSTIKNYDDLPLLTQSSGLVLTGDTKNLELLVDETMTVTGMEMQLMYAPDMEWEWDNSVSLKTKTNPSTEAPEYWETEDDNGTLTWKATTQARLRIHTGVAGDIVEWKIRSDKYVSRSYSCDYYTATTDASGNAYFYGTTEDEMTDNFEVTLTHTLGTPLGEPVLLLKASSVNPIHLEAGKAYVFNASGIRN